MMARERMLPHTGRMYACNRPVHLINRKFATVRRGEIRSIFSETQTSSKKPMYAGLPSAYFWATLWPMRCTEFLKARVSPEIKLRTKAVADREFISEAAWLKRLVLREIRACDAARDSEVESSRAEGIRRAGREARGASGDGKPMLVRLRNEDRLLLDARAEARGMRPATYASVLLRSHMRQLTPLPPCAISACSEVVSGERPCGSGYTHLLRQVHLPQHRSEAGVAAQGGQECVVPHVA
jgi:hypothetical protein